MSKPSRRPTREARKEHKQKRREAQRQLRAAQAQRGVVPPRAASVSNRLCPYSTEAEEQAGREDAVAGQLGVFRALLPKLLKDLGKIPDPRQPKKVKHKLTVVLLYGLLSFVLQMASRREANRELSHPAFLATLQQLFPELESLPHADTLNRLLSELDVAHLEQAHVALLQRLIRNKKFRRYLIAQCYPIAIDGTQKLVRSGPWWAEEWLERRRETAEGESVQQYVYVLEANLVLHNGVTLPLLSEFLSYGEGDPDDHKQDCELKAFYRLAARLKAYFPRLPIVVLLDGLYPNGPLMALARQYQWQFMIVLPAKCLPSVWEEVEALKPRLPHHRKHQHWRGRQQQFWWVNDITYSYEGDRKSLLVHVVGCEETWQEVDPATGELIDKQTQHVWLSSQRLCHHTVHERCNLGARQRWGIEVSMQVEKRQGYCYEHAFSHHWNAMQGYHYLMRLAHLLNALALATKRVANQVRTLGVQAFLRFVRESCAHRWLQREWIEHFRATPLQLRLE
jgi:DDE family transposase